MQQRYYSLNQFLRTRHNGKVIKLSIDGGFTCPNRDGTISTTGCLFCSDRGSGDFTFGEEAAITNQLIKAQSLLATKWGAHTQYIAYFQAFTNTYAPLNVLKQKYEAALSFPGVVGIAIATRPDCLTDEVLDYLAELSTRTHVWVELGLQTIHPHTTALINRGYTLEIFEMAIKKLHQRSIECVVHLILGLPNETPEDMIASAKYLSDFPLQGIKLHMLHVLDNSPLGTYYTAHPFPFMSEADYIALIGEILMVLPEHFVIHRLTGDGPKEHLIGPLWTKNKRHVLNSMTAYFKIHDIYQGKNLNKC